MEITVLGSGTSTGVPMIGCRCEVCRSADPRNQRSRASIYVRDSVTRLLVDTSTDLRSQAIRHGIDGVDAVLYTHHHADHVHGIDELRSFNYLQNGPIPCYGNRATIERLVARFDYVFSSGNGRGYRPQLRPHVIDQVLSIGDLTVEPIEVVYGADLILGYRFGAAAYITDCSEIPDRSKARLQGLDLLIVSAIRYQPHPTHFTLDQALGAIEELSPRRAVLTHLSHVFDFDQVTRTLPTGVELAYDGLVLHA